MKRSVIQLAGKTHVVSLPSKWVKSYGIKKGHTLDVEEQGSQILIRPEKQEKEVKSISFNIDNLNIETFGYTMSALHKVGYDEITLYYEKPKLKDAIQYLLHNLLLGFVVIEQTSKKIVLKNVSNELESEFNPTLRRTFLVIISLSNSSLDMISAKQFKNLNSLLSLENSVNQLTSFCLRLINKGFYKNQEKKMFMATIIWSLEKISDEYKTICITLSKNDKDISKEILKVYKEINDYFNLYYDLFYKFSSLKVNEVIHKKELLINYINDIHPKTKNESRVLNCLSTILSKTSDLSSSIVALNHEELIKN